MMICLTMDSETPVKREGAEKITQSMSRLVSVRKQERGKVYRQCKTLQYVRRTGNRDNVVDGEPGG